MCDNMIISLIIDRSKRANESLKLVMCQLEKKIQLCLDLNFDSCHRIHKFNFYMAPALRTINRQNRLSNTTYFTDEKYYIFN